MPSNRVSVVVRADTPEKITRNHIAQLRANEIKAGELSKTELIAVVNEIIGKGVEAIWPTIVNRESTG